MHGSLLSCNSHHTCCWHLRMSVHKSDYICTECGRKRGELNTHASTCCTAHVTHQVDLSSACKSISPNAATSKLPAASKMRAVTDYAHATASHEPIQEQSALTMRCTSSDTAQSVCALACSCNTTLVPQRAPTPTEKPSQKQPLQLWPHVVDHSSAALGWQGQLSGPSARMDPPSTLLVNLHVNLHILVQPQQTKRMQESARCGKHQTMCCRCCDCNKQT
jgi:hypothetical protein